MRYIIIIECINLLLAKSSGRKRLGASSVEVTLLSLSPSPMYNKRPVASNYTWVDQNNVYCVFIVRVEELEEQLLSLKLQYRQDKKILEWYVICSFYHA